MKTFPYEAVSMRLHHCKGGWIRMSFGTQNATVETSLSECFDPIPNFMNWMEALLTGVMRCGFDIEEEGPEKRFSAQTCWKGRYWLTVSEYENEPPYLKAVVHRRQLIEILYRGFQAFGKSRDYTPKEWGCESMGEFLARKTHTTQEAVMEFLNGLNTNAYTRFWHVVSPTHCCGPSDEVTRMNSLREILDFALQPENPLVAKSLAEYAAFSDEGKWEKKYPDQKVRTLAWMNTQASMFAGTPLHTLRHEALEAYLESNRDCDTLENS